MPIKNKFVSVTLMGEPIKGIPAMIGPLTKEASQDMTRGPGDKKSRCIDYVEYKTQNVRVRFYVSSALNWYMRTWQGMWVPILYKSEVMELLENGSEKHVELKEQFKG